MALAAGAGAPTSERASAWLAGPVATGPTVTVELPCFKPTIVTVNETPAMTLPSATTVETTWVKPIDAAGLAAFAEKGRNNPGAKGTVRSRTVYDGQFRSLTYVGQHAPVVVDEPPHLFGQDTAPAPSEILLSGLGGCLCVGIHAVATHRGVNISRMEVALEGDIGNPSAWGAGGAAKEPLQMGFQAVRAKIRLRDSRVMGLPESARARDGTLAALPSDRDGPKPMTDCPKNGTIRWAWRRAGG
jgi:hypothetical protein